MFIVTLCTCPNKNIARSIARELIEGKYAACVNIIPRIESVYMWEGKVTIDNEHLLLIKSKKDNYTQIELTIKQNHPYSCPEIISLPIQQGSKEYLQWIKCCN